MLNVTQRCVRMMELEGQGHDDGEDNEGGDGNRGDRQEGDEGRDELPARRKKRQAIPDVDGDFSIGTPFHVVFFGGWGWGGSNALDLCRFTTNRFNWLTLTNEYVKEINLFRTRNITSNWSRG